MEKIIHIHAKCTYFEIHEQVPEKRAVTRLVRIRNNYNWCKRRNGSREEGLIVKTRIVNPEFMFS